VSGSATVRPDPVLVVDDDPDARALISLTLRRAGLDVVDAGSGDEALRVVSVRPIAVVVCDLGMSGMSGLDVVRELRRRPATTTLPFILMTGSGEADTVIEALDAGADDFLGKPVRLDELVARVRAHMRKHAAWSEVLEQELRGRATVVAALGQLALSSDPEEAAVVVVTELAERTDSEYVGVLQVSIRGGLHPLATLDPVRRVQRGGPAVPASRSRELVARAQNGPWVETMPEGDPGDAIGRSWPANIDLVAGAPIHVGDDVVGILFIGVTADPGGPPRHAREGRLLASVIDFASVLSAVAGPAIADRQHAAGEQARLRRILAGREFHAVFQPIVSLDGGAIVGYEALTRFDDGTPPDVRFAEAAAIHLQPDFELAAIDKAIEDATALSDGVLLALNVSPAVILGSGRRLRRSLARSAVPVVLELTEHAAISDYTALRGAIAGLPGVRIAIDDAGAGYASLRHVLELRPAFAKLDMTLVRGIHTDPMRQALAAGLQYYAQRTECRLIAEGVESRDEADSLAGIGVEYAQGYLFGRPERLPIPAT
jgi:EAL domain-containing protein (putative c-di-GMP-specific phosphodiesterase class I)/DNA-binding response OmpR family regulator